MSNVSFYPQNPVTKQDQPINSHYIQKILDENVSLIHTIIEKQQHSQESDELLKNLHKNLIYLATIADQTTSVVNNGGPPSQTPYNSPYNNAGVPVAALQSNNYHSQSSNSNIQPPPLQQSPYMMAAAAGGGGGVSSSNLTDKRFDPEDQSTSKEISNNTKIDFGGFGVDMDKESNKISSLSKEGPPPPLNKSADMELNTTNEGGTVVKNEGSVGGGIADNMFSGHNIKTDMPPPSQLPLGVHGEKASVGSVPQRSNYPQLNPNFPQYNSPHFDHQQQPPGKFYPPSPQQQQQQQSQYQQSPYNYQNNNNMYNNNNNNSQYYSQQQQHMMMMNSAAAGAPMYPQYPQYYQQPPPSSLPIMEHNNLKQPLSDSITTTTTIPIITTTTQPSLTNQTLMAD